MANDPKAQEYAHTLENLTLMKAEIDGLKEEVQELRIYLAEACGIIADVSKVVAFLQKRGNKK